MKVLDNVCKTVKALDNVCKTVNVLENVRPACLRFVDHRRRFRITQFGFDYPTKGLIACHPQFIDHHGILAAIAYVNFVEELEHVPKACFRLVTL